MLWLALVLALAWPTQAVADVAYEKKLARAQHRYNKLWAKADALFGADGRPAPRVAFGQPKTNMGDDEQGMRRVNLTAFDVRGLGNRNRGSTRRVRRKKKFHRTGAKDALLHEWAHTYQDPALLADWKGTNRSGREIAAETFADVAGRRLLGKSGKRFYRLNPTQDFQRDWLATRGMDYLMRGQFGSNWGADPTTIKYPGRTAQRRKLRRR